MTTRPLIRNKEDRERVRRSLEYRATRLFNKTFRCKDNPNQVIRNDADRHEHGVYCGMIRAKQIICGPIPKPKKKARKK